NDEAVTRLRADETNDGSGSGFQSAKRLIEALSGSIRILSSTPAGTEIQIILPHAFLAVSPCSVADIAELLPGFHLIDFDQRDTFEAALSTVPAPKEQIIACTYDDTSITRGRLADLVGMVFIKPLCREMAAHPRLKGGSKEV